jgi:hypothetical protein
MITNASRARKAALSGVAAIVLAAGLMAASSNEASAQWRYHGHYGGWGGGGAVAAGVVGGLALGALAAGAASNPGPYYDGPPPGYYGPARAYGGPACWMEPEDAWNGVRWVRHNVRVCQ